MNHGLLPTQSLAGQPGEPWAPWHPFAGGDAVARGSLGGEWAGRTLGVPPVLASRESWENTYLPRVSLQILVILYRFRRFLPVIQLTDFYRLHGVDCSPRFCRKFVLRRNHLIERVELFEESPILPLSRCLEAC